MIVEEQDKIILINKPIGWTSFDVVKKIRNCLGVRKVGHAGTLDPLATGLLILCTGKKTKEINEIQEMEKEYLGEFTLGQTTDSFDLESPPKFVSDCKNVHPDSIIEIAKKFVGTIEQIPPEFSAIKVDGQRAYIKARKGEKQSIQPRKITLHSFEILKIEIPLITI
jgi:tRNA pseudouridine55 synthase